MSNLIEVLGFCNSNIEAMGALRTVKSFMFHCDPDLNTNNPQANTRKGMRMIAKFPTIATSFSRLKRGLNMIEPDHEMSHGTNFLYMLRGSRPTNLEARIIESDFILSTDHELNPSTFAARTVTSTLSDLHSAVIEGLCTLKGPLHGGARMAVMNMLDEIDSPKGAQNFVLHKIEKHEKLMEIGHRVYKTYDPRARVYKQLAREIAMEKNDMKWFEIAEKIEGGRI